MGPVICLVTDTARGGADAAVARVHTAARAGVHLIQVRERHLDGRPLARLVSRCLEAVAATSTRVLVNDRLDVALAAGAHGVHLPAGAPPASRVRAIVPAGFLIGRSIHATDDAIAAAADGGVDYLIFGTCFPTESKPGRAAAGAQTLAAVVEAVPVPVLAIGGVTLDRLEAIRRAGAAGFAAIGLFADEAMLPQVLRRLAAQDHEQAERPR